MKSRLQTHGGTLHWLSTIAVIAADLSLWQNIPLFSKAYQRGYRVNTKQNGSFRSPRLYAKPLLITAITAIVLPLTLSVNIWHVTVEVQRSCEIILAMSLATLRHFIVTRWYTASGSKLRLFFFYPVKHELGFSGCVSRKDSNHKN